jgi:D-alanyl-D-alanine carboxypeptidase/D-alanyl-D-alanine-endopeptidase (penicillin-binding protein 4)
LTLNSGYARLRPTPVPAGAPATAAAAALAALLERRGVQVGGVGEGAAPVDAVVVSMLESLPIREVVAEMLQQSDNTTAELLTKELGFLFGEGGSTEAGLAVIRAHAIAALGTAAGGFTLSDGSGLDRSNRATCDALTALLELDVAERALRPVLPVAAQSGTLSRRFVGTAAAGHIAAKTGSLEGVVALSGYATDERDEALVFATLVSDPRDDVAGALVDRVAVILAGYPDGPTPRELSP